eukprot:1160412-Pelagomonas_calceolata.AAC.7
MAQIVSEGSHPPHAELHAPLFASSYDHIILATMTWPWHLLHLQERTMWEAGDLPDLHHPIPSSTNMT